MADRACAARRTARHPPPGATRAKDSGRGPASAPPPAAQRAGPKTGSALVLVPAARLPRKVRGAADPDDSARRPAERGQEQRAGDSAANPSRIIIQER